MPSQCGAMAESKTRDRVIPCLKLATAATGGHRRSFDQTNFNWALPRFYLEPFSVLTRSYHAFTMSVPRHYFGFPSTTLSHPCRSISLKYIYIVGQNRVPNVVFATRCIAAYSSAFTRFAIFFSRACDAKVEEKPGAAVLQQHRPYYSPRAHTRSPYT